MLCAEQGDLLKIEGIAHPVIVVSNNFFNKENAVLVCPIVRNAIPGPLHIPLTGVPVEGYVLCEQVRYLDLRQRRYTKLTSTHYFDIMDITDAVMGIFEG
ncbi:MAG: type II toxin-antitoxin system PemK/MazF family toxin [Clostridia bacterium]|nr:type II toxin-antitoxin system PemK/MazF family toxin [Clostridia bacterium]